MLFHLQTPFSLSLCKPRIHLPGQNGFSTKGGNLSCLSVKMESLGLGGQRDRSTRTQEASLTCNSDLKKLVYTK